MSLLLAVSAANRSIAAVRWLTLLSTAAARNRTTTLIASRPNSTSSSNFSATFSDGDGPLAAASSSNSADGDDGGGVDGGGVSGGGCDGDAGGRKVRSLGLALSYDEAVKLDAERRRAQRAEEAKNMTPEERAKFINEPWRRADFYKTEFEKEFARHEAEERQRKISSVKMGDDTKPSYGGPGESRSWPRRDPSNRVLYDGDTDVKWRMFAWAVFLTIMCWGILGTLHLQFRRKL